MRRLLHFTVLCMLFVPMKAKVIYVALDATGAGDGTSWADAYPNLQNALNSATAGDDIYVKAGLYYPDRTPTGDFSPANSNFWCFYANASVNIYGGFKGDESSPNERRLDMYVTELSGDLGVPGDNADNTYHVFWAVGGSIDILMDGFVISDAHARSLSSSPNRDGAGIHAENIGNLTLRNLLVEDNVAIDDGGGISVENAGDVVFENLVIRNNIAQGQYGSPSGGAGVRLDGLDSFEGNGLVIFGNTCTGNGGGIFAKSIDPNPFELYNSIIYNNTTTIDGGGVYLNGVDNANIVHNTFYQNNADDDGHSVFVFNNSSLEVGNSIFWNSSTPVGEQVFVRNPSGTNYANISFSIVQNTNGSGGSWTGSATDSKSNLDEDPLFEDADGGDNILGTLDDNFYLTEVSPGFDAANSSLSASLPSDALGLPRVQGVASDMGALERMIVTTFPVEWLSFTAEWASQDQERVVLEWSTAQEINNSAYWVERSTDQTQSWQAIAKLSAAGSTDEISEYQFVDHEAGDMQGVPLHYRLRQVDIDGGYSFSSVQMVNLKRLTDNAPQAFPNPVASQGLLNVAVSSDLLLGTKVLQFELIDLNGRVVYQHTESENLNEAYVLSLPDLAPGLYTLCLNNASGRIGQLLEVRP